MGGWAVLGNINVLFYIKLVLRYQNLGVYNYHEETSANAHEKHVALGSARTAGSRRNGAADISVEKRALKSDSC